MNYRNRSPRPFAAKYPGSCLCGARFERGAPIFWDGSVRRATLCPSCRPRRAVKGQTRMCGHGISVRVDTHPDTGAPAVVALSTIEEFGKAEVYRLRGGRWQLTGGGMVFCAVHSHEQIEALIAEHRGQAAA